jgi:hypothetical protein
LREVTALWRLSGHSDRNFDFVVLPRHQFEGAINNLATDAASVGSFRAESLNVTEHTVERMRESFVPNLRKSVSRASRELRVPESRVKKTKEMLTVIPVQIAVDTKTEA